MTVEAMQLVLYITPGSLPCQRALLAVRNILERYDSRRINVEVLDPAEQPEAAQRDRVMFTPTLIKRSPGAQASIVGDLSNPDALVDLLQISSAS